MGKSTASFAKDTLNLTLELMQAHVAANPDGYRKYSVEEIYRTPAKYTTEKGNPEADFFRTSAKLIEMCREYIDSHESTNPNRAAVLKKFVGKPKDDSRRSRALGAFEHDGHYVYINHNAGAMVRIDEDYPSVYHVEDDADKINSDRLMPMRYKNGAPQYISGEECYLAEDFPDAPALKTELDLYKERLKGKESKRQFAAPAVYRPSSKELEGIELLYNPELALQMRQILPEAKVYITKDWKKPLIFMSDEGDGLMMPCRPATPKSYVQTA